MIDTLVARPAAASPKDRQATLDAGVDAHVVKPVDGERLGSCLSAAPGRATAVSWVAYFKALSLGSATPVTAIDKASLAVMLGLSALLLGETVGWRAGVGVGMIVAGALLVGTD
jgi:hypothetical protein